ncbi:MAG: redoxin domain-containing protein [Polyangiaceae bacterium]
MLGISKDSVAGHEKFRDKYALNFPLLSDADLKVHKAFGAYGEKTMYGKKVLGTIRSTFILDPEQGVARAFPNVKVDGHADAVLATAELKGGKAPAPAARVPAPKAASPPQKAAAKPLAKRRGAKAATKKR